MVPSDLLLVLDDSDANDSVLALAARLVRQRQEVRIGLMYLLPDPPPELLEFGGAEDPRREERLDAALKEKQRAWLARIEREAQPVLGRAADALRAAGVDPRGIEPRLSAPGVHAADARAAEILALARAQGYGTVIVRDGQTTSAGEDLAAALAARAGDVHVERVA